MKNLATALSIAMLGLTACGTHGGHTGTIDTTTIDQTGRTLYVALGHTGAIAIVDIDSWRVAKTLTLSAAYFPHHLSVFEGGAKISVAAPSADLSMGHASTGGHAGHGGATSKSGIFVIDSRTGDVLAQTEVDGTAHNAGFVSGGLVAYALAEHGMVHFADPATLAAVGQADIGGSPLEATPVPGTSFVLVAQSANGRIDVVDAFTRQVTASIPTGANPIGAWIATNGRAYVTSESDKMLTAIDTSSLKAVGTTVSLSGTPGQVTTAKNGTEVWVALEDAKKVVIFSASDMSLLAEIVVGQRPHGLATDPDGTTVYLTDEDGGKLFALDVATRSIARELPLEGAPNGIVFRGAL